MGLQQNFMNKDLKRLIQSRKVKVKLKGELHRATDKSGYVQWLLKYRLVPKNIKVAVPINLLNLYNWNTVFKGLVSFCYLQRQVLYTYHPSILPYVLQDCL